MRDLFDNRIIALAGLTQAICLAKEIAQTGKITTAAFETSLNSLFEIHPTNAESVFGGLTNLRFGLEKCAHLLNGKDDTSPFTMRHILSIIRLQKKIFRAPASINKLTLRIQQAKKQVDYFSILHPTVISNLADIYLDITHSFHFRFFMLGKKQFLRVDENREKIQSLLLAAIRAALLWQQMGGSRLHFIFSRKKMKESAKRLLQEISMNAQPEL